MDFPGRLRTAWIAGAVAAAVLIGLPAHAKSAAELSLDSSAALKQLLDSNAVARTLADSARGILVFPTIVKGGFLFGGQFGEGALLEPARTTAFYRTVSASYGLQAGIQKYGYALFLMNQGAVEYLNKSDGWELGVGPTLTVVDEGFSGSFSTTTARSDVYAFFFDQKGLMAGLGLQGTKLFRIHPD
jgi:lipid-binding SYLF domain-containing protein